MQNSRCNSASGSLLIGLLNKKILKCWEIWWDKRMGYYIRILSKNDKPISIEQIKNRIKNDKIKVKIQIDDYKEGVYWEQFIVSHEEGREICVVERNDVSTDSLGQEELNEFLEDVINYEPKKAAEWLQAYLKDIKVIYAFQILSGADINDGWSAIHSIQGEIWGSNGGIMQSDGEGFTNEEGYHILWQFSDSVDGPWYMSILNDEGKWIKFEMDLGNKNHRKAFIENKIPDDVELIK